MITNKEIAEAFRKAKPFLTKPGPAINEDSNFMSPYICDAIVEANGGFDAGISIAARAIIRERLGREHSVEGWLSKHVFEAADIKRNSGLNRYWENQVQAYRHRWLDALIEEFESK